MRLRFFHTFKCILEKKYVKKSTLKELNHYIKESKNNELQTTINGWINHIRKHKNVSFITICDGTIHNELQIVIEHNKIKLPETLCVGSNINVFGDIIMRNNKKTNEILYEILAENIEEIGASTSEYPFQKLAYPMEYGRQYSHLRCRTSTFASMMRIRNGTIVNINKYLQDQGFIQIHTPTLTPLDCEGAGELFTLNEIDKKRQFFGTPMHLTVSGQLYAEMVACAMNRVYNFGPTFRAEKSHTVRHLSEFWMIEPEMINSNLDDIIELTENIFKNSISYLLDKYYEDLNIVHKKSDHDIINELKNVINISIPRITYTEAIDILLKQTTQKFEFPVKWETGLHAEHEKYLTQHFNNTPIFVINYPTILKPFYMKRCNDNHKTVACMDFLVPRVGELAGGSEREDNYQQLYENLKQHEMNEQQYQWYLDLRKYGSVPHAGFGLGFERFLQYISGWNNIKDTTLVPRYQSYHAPFSL